MRLGGVAIVLALGAAGCSSGGGGGGGGGSAPRDSTPPTIVATLPPNGSFLATVYGPIAAVFSEPIDGASASVATFTVVDGGGAPVAGTVSCSGTMVSFFPALPFAYSATYTATLGTGLRDLAGNALAQPYSFGFTTPHVSDVTPPWVVSTSPYASDVPVDVQLGASFSEPIDPASVATAFLLSDGLGREVPGAVAASGSFASFTPDVPLDFSTTYLATVAAGVRDLAGNVMTVDRAWTFTTADPANLTVVPAGTGFGVVASTPAGIACGGGGPCSGTFSRNATVTLSATPAAGSTFMGFVGAYATIRQSCAVDLQWDGLSITAVFDADLASSAGNQLGLDGFVDPIGNVASTDVVVHELGANPPPSALDLRTFTIEAWVFPLANRAMLVAADSAYYLMLRGDDLRMELAVMTSTHFPAYMTFSPTSHPLQLGRWNHVAGMIDDLAGTMRLAVNGDLSDLAPMAGAVDAGWPQTFSLGNSYPSALGNYPFVGRIDEVRLSSIVRYDEDFTPSPLVDADDATVGLWHLDEPAGATTFADASGHGHDLTALGRAATVAGPRPAPLPASGALVTGFGGGGELTVNPSAYADVPVAVLVAGGGLVVVGSDQADGPAWRLEKRDLLTGAPVTSFGTAGVVYSNPTSQYDEPTAAVSDGTYLYVVGYDSVPSFDYEWRIEKRLASTGELVPDFGTGGVVTENPNYGPDRPVAVVQDGTSLYVFGYQWPSNGDPLWRIEKRDLVTGDLVPGFGSGGVVVGSVAASPAAAVMDGTSLFVTGKMDGTSGSYWRIEKRSLDTGALATDFGVSGVVTSAQVVDSHPCAITTDGTSIYVAGGGGPGASYDWRWLVERRDASTGALVPTFGVDGLLSMDFGPGADEATVLVVDGNALYVAGMVRTSAPEWRIEKRSLDSGALVPGFGAGGAVTSAPGVLIDAVTVLAVDGASLFVAGMDHATGGRWRVEKRVK
jgi:hypothetical protein